MCLKCTLKTLITPFRYQPSHHNKMVLYVSANPGYVSFVSFQRITLTFLDTCILPHFLVGRRRGWPLQRHLSMTAAKQDMTP